MLKLRVLWCAVFCLLVQSAFASKAALIEVDGTINPASAQFIKESLSKAKSEGHSFLVLVLNTPGGLLTSTRDIIADISNSSLPVVTYVAPSGARATSAGALIAIASHLTVLAPGTHMGAAHPVGGGGEDIEGEMGKKATSDTAALARTQAVLRGRNPATAERIVTESLSLSADEALKEKMAEVIAPSLDDLLRSVAGREIRLKGTDVVKIQAVDASQVQRFEMTLPLRALHFISDPNISALLIGIGGLAIYTEVSSGFSLGIPGIVGAILLILGFTSLSMLPIQTGALLMMLFGFGLLIAEVFITSFGLLFVAGAACVVAGALFLIEPGAADIQISLSIIVPFLLGLLTVAALIGYQMKKKRHAANASTVDAGSLAQVKSVEAGGRGGYALVNGELWRFESDVPLQEGEQARVVRSDGLKIILGRRI